MAGAQGFGSALALRAKEAAQRAKTSDALGLSSPLPSGVGEGLQAMPGDVPVQRAQPVTPPASNPPLDERMLGIAEEFLAGLQPQLYGEKPKGHAAAGITPPGGIPGVGGFGT